MCINKSWKNKQKFPSFLKSGDFGVYNGDGDTSNCNLVYSADNNTQIIRENLSVKEGAELNSSDKYDVLTKTRNDLKPLETI